MEVDKMHILLDKDTKIDKMDDDSSPPLIKACSREVRPSFDPLLTYTPLQIRN
jgi:hypothetical protein